MIWLIDGLTAELMVDWLNRLTDKLMVHRLMVWFMNWWWINDNFMNWSIYRLIDGWIDWLDIQIGGLSHGRNESAQIDGLMMNLLIDQLMD